MIDYWEGSASDGMVDGIKAIQNKPYIYAKHFAPHDIKATEIATGITRIDTAKKLGIKFEVIPKLSVDDGINKGKLFFAKLWIDEKKCENWIDAISQYHQAWNDKRGMFEDKPYHDWTSHPADVHRYAAIVEEQMTNEEVKVYKQKPYEAQSDYEGR